MDILHTIAEISIAFAGFAGIVFAFLAKEGLTNLAMWRVRNLLLASFATMIAALVPLGFEYTVLREESWDNLASLSLGVLISVLAGFVITTFLRNDLANQTDVGRKAFFPVMSLVVLNAVIQLLNGVGILGENTMWVFIYGLQVMLLVNAIQFLFSVLDRTRGDA